MASKCGIQVTLMMTVPFLFVIPSCSAQIGCKNVPQQLLFSHHNSVKVFTAQENLMDENKYQDVCVPNSP